LALSCPEFNLDGYNSPPLVMGGSLSRNEVYSANS
jgi:hypothetical protein